MSREGAPFHSALDRPFQGAEVRKEVTSGPPALPGRESARGQQHGGKAWSIVKALMVLLRKARVIWRRPDCLKPSSQGWKCASSDIQRPERSHRYQANPLCFAPTLPTGGRWAASSLKGTDGTPTSRSIRPAQGEFGITYGVRALG